MVRLALLAFLIILPTQTAALTVDEIVQKSEDVMVGNSGHSILQMTVKTPRWRRRVDIESWSHGPENNPLK